MRPFTPTRPRKDGGKLQLLALLGGAALALLSVTCAPVVPPVSTTPSVEPVEKPPAEPVAVLPAPSAAGPRLRLEAAIDNIRSRDMLTTNGFWTIFHGILGLGPALTLRNPETSEKVNALDFIADGGELRGLNFLPTKHGLDVQIGPLGIGQGHQDQFVAEMIQWGTPINKKFVVLGKDYTFMDFVRHAQMRARTTSNQELSWAVIVVGQHLGTDVSWTNAHGEKLRFEDMMRYELDANVENAACGGTHRLFGLTWAYHLHLAKGGEPSGVWHEVPEKNAKYRDLAKKFRNPDGSFSTDFFRGPGNATDKQLRINTTGHILEWLALALTDDELKEQWVQDAVNALSLMILDLQDAPIEGGSLYHAAHGLLIYYARVYGTEFLGPNKPFLPPYPGAAAKKTDDE